LIFIPKVLIGKVARIIGVAREDGGTNTFDLVVHGRIGMNIFEVRSGLED
jgi:hypothetical protein